MMGMQTVVNILKVETCACLAVVINVLDLCFGITVLTRRKDL